MNFLTKNGLQFGEKISVNDNWWKLDWIYPFNWRSTRGAQVT